MKKYLLLSIIFLLLPFSSFAKERTQEEAHMLAIDFLSSSEMVNTRSQAPVVLIASSSQIFGTHQLQSNSSASAFFIFNQGDDAFVIVSGDDRLEPVLGYSLKKGFDIDRMPANLLSWLKVYVNEYNFVLQSGFEGAYPQPLMQTNSYPASVSPLLGEIQWNQDAPYNDLCPEYNGDHSVTGCVATAMAQVMRYHNYPVTGEGSYSYTTSTLGLSASFDFGATTFEWADMLTQYVTGEYTDAQGNAVAELMYACGVSVSMDYTTDESGAEPIDAAEALSKYFKYDSNIKYLLRDYFGYSEWIGLIKEEISNSRPVMYDGQSTEGGHEFVFDGYDENDMVHVNWGWSGTDNGYFAITALAPSALGIGGGNNLGGGFSSDQGMIIGIQQPTSSSTYQSYFLCSELTPASTSFSLGSSTDFTITEFINMSITFPGGQLAIIVEKDDVQTVLGSMSLSEMTGNEEINSVTINDIDFPDDLASGTYTMYAATRASSVENPWSKVRGVMGEPTQYYVTVSDGEVTISDYWGTIDLTATMDVEHALYYNLLGDFELKVDNNSSSQEYYGEIGVGVISSGELVSVVQSLMIYMPAGEKDLAITISDTLSSSLYPGDYEVCPVASWGNDYYTIGTSQSVTINESDGIGTLSIESFGVESSEIAYGSNVTTVGVFTLSGESNVYSNTLTVALFESSGTSSIGEFYTNVFFDETPYNFSFSFNPELSIGSYKLALYEPSGSSYQQISDEVEFSILDPSDVVGLKSINADKLILNVADEELWINLDSGIDRVIIYNMEGKVLMREKVSAQPLEYSVNISSLPAGSYVITVDTGQKQISQKFIKQ